MNDDTSQETLLPVKSIKHIKKLQPLSPHIKTHGGGGVVYPDAQGRLLEILRSPRANEPL
jgi:hypothetical protein